MKMTFNDRIAEIIIMRNEKIIKELERQRQQLIKEITELEFQKIRKQKAKNDVRGKRAR